MEFLDLGLALVGVALALAFVIRRFRPAPRSIVHEVEVRGGLAKGLALAQKKRRAKK